MLDLVLNNVHLPDGRVKDIGIRQGRVVHLGEAGKTDLAVDCAPFLCIPGAVDMHVHMRGGEESYKEDWRTGSRSALAGGVTLIVDQPNTLPPLTSVPRFRERVNEAQRQSCCHFGINAGIPSPPHLRDLWEEGPLAFGEIFLAPSTHGGAISLDALGNILPSLRELGALCTLHAEAAAPRPPRDLEEHDRERSPEAEGRMVREIGARSQGGDTLHFCHLSSPQGIDSAKGTVEVTPHHLFLSFEDFAPQDARGKVNPPLRSNAVRKSLWERWDRIDVIASDHAPHTREEKRRPFPEAPAGLPGVETMIPLLMAAVLDRRITLPSLIAKTSQSPARILGIPPSGFDPGCRADFALFPRKKTRISIDMLHSRCDWTPFEGREGVFPEHVFLEGALAFQEGEFSGRRGRWYSGRGYKERGTI